jgi:hypothetical protein
MNERTFEAKPATREAGGLLIGIVGPSSSGKTRSAMRLAAGIQRVVGGEIDIIDTENRRALHYADKLTFNHIPFAPPFSPLDYLDAVRFCARRGTKTVIVDSASHEHEGPGGVLEWHAEETERLAKAWKVSHDKAQIAAWGPPKAARRKFINELLQMNINLIMTFRAKEKLKIQVGKQPQELGWMPICGEEFMYEMALQCLLKPGCKGTPTWDSNMEGERSIIKIPEYLQEAVKADKSIQIDEEMGEALAKWAMGGAKPAPEMDQLMSDYAKCLTLAEFGEIEKRRAAIWSKPAPSGYKARVKTAADTAAKRLAEQPASEPTQKLTLDTALKAIQSAATLPELASIYDSIVTDYQTHQREVPVELEGAHGDRKAALEQEEQ